MNDHGERQDDRRRHSIAAVTAFTALMHANERGELEAAAESRIELERPGIEVRITGHRTHAPDGGRND